MFIQTESTPNPATLKFLPGQTVLETGTADFPEPGATGRSPLARRLFGVEGVAGVFLGHDFVTVTKTEGVEWDHIKPAILGAFVEHFQSGEPTLEGGAAESAHAEHSGENAEIVTQIKELLDTRVRPAVAADGGDITFHGFERGVVAHAGSLRRMPVLDHHPQDGHRESAAPLHSRSHGGAARCRLTRRFWDSTPRARTAPPRF